MSDGPAALIICAIVTTRESESSAQALEAEEFDVDTSPERLDKDAVWDYLSTEAYWGRWRTREQFDTQVASAWRVVGVYRRSTGELVGFARATSDGVAFAFLSDLFVLPAARGQGLSKRILTEMIEQGPGRGFRWMLHTADAHGLYRQFGFGGPNEMYMERPDQHG
jgi:GNAT superfamily N-acetyltransferase